MKNAPSFTESININCIYGVSQTTLIWPEITRTYEEKKYKDTILKLLTYLNASALKKRGNKDKTHFVFPHGQTTIYLTIENGKYHIKAPFLKLPEKNSVIILRRITEINFSILLLSQLNLKGNELYFEFSDFIEHCEPNKLYDLLDEICFYSDYYGPLFQKKFGAKLIQPPEIKILSNRKKNKAWKNYQKILEESLKYFSYFESKRLDDFCVDITYITLKKLDYCFVSRGYLRSQLIEYTRELNEENISLQEARTRGRKILEKLQKIDEKSFKASLYSCQFLVPPKADCDKMFFHSFLKERLHIANTELSRRDYIGATLTLTRAIYDLFQGYSLPYGMVWKLHNAIQFASNKPWPEAAQELKEGMQKAIGAQTDTQRKLFGRYHIKTRYIILIYAALVLLYLLLKSLKIKGFM